MKTAGDNPLVVRYSDAAHRCSDVIRTHLAAEGYAAIGRWVAIRLSDGGSDGNLYATKREAIRFQLHETQCAYAQIPPGADMTPRAAENFLSVNRQLYDAGMRITDPDDSPDVHITERQETWSQYGLKTPSPKRRSR